MTVSTMEKLISAAGRLASSEGVKDFSIEQIVKEAGVSKGAFSYHFPAKELMLAQLVETTLETTLKALEDAALEYGTQGSERVVPQVKHCRRNAEGSNRCSAPTLLCFSRSVIG